MRRATRWSGLIAIAAAAACSSDSAGPASQSSALNMDAALVAGDIAAQDVEVMRGPGGAAFGMRLAAHPGSFDCARESPAGLTVTRTCVYKDASGAVQPAYDANTTASVDVSVSIVGSIDRGHVSATVDRTRALVATGLEGQEASITWNGTGSGTLGKVRTSSDGTTRSYEVSGSTVITDVVIPVPRTETSWPLSGTIQRSLTLTKPDGSTVQRDVIVIFNGTQIVPITVNGETFDFDLATRHRPRQHRG